MRSRLHTLTQVAGILSIYYSIIHSYLMITPKIVREGILTYMS